LKLGQIFDMDITVKADQYNVHAIIDQLLDDVMAGRIVLDDITHRLSLEEVTRRYQIFDKSWKDV